MHIDSYQFGSITIDGKTYSSDLILFRNHIQDSWWREEGHYLQVKDMDAIFAAKPKTIIIGRGASGVMDIAEEVREKCKEEGIRLIDKWTKEAAEYYNNLTDKNSVVAGFHLTC